MTRHIASMIEEALDHLAHAGGPARRPLLGAVTVLLCMMLIVRSIHAQTLPPQSEAIDEPAIARAVELFLANRQVEALQALDPETLDRSGKANLLAGLIYLNRPHENPDKARLYFERAGRLGVSHAYAALGNLILGDDCADCPVRAAKLLSQALADHDDPDARLGLALDWIELGKKESAQAEFDRLLEDPTPLYIRVLAASFAGAFRLESDPKVPRSFCFSRPGRDQQARRKSSGCGICATAESRKRSHGWRVRWDNAPNLP